MQEDPFVRPGEVASWLNVSVLSLWRWEKAGLFPKRVQLGPKAVAWRRSEIEAWLAERNRGIKENPEHSALLKGKLTQTD